MKNTKQTRIVLIVLAATILSATALIQSAKAVSPLNLYLFAPKTAAPGQTIPIELWTIYDNSTGAPSGTTRPDLAFNASQSGATCSNFPCLTFLVKINLPGVTAPPHVHTPSGGFVALPAFKQWVHPGAWNTSYTVPAELGLYGVHMYANYTVHPSVNVYNSYIAQAQTAFTVANTPASPSDVTNAVSGLATQNLGYALLGLVVVAIALDVVILVWKKSPTKTA